jgi:hypothetical protein
MSADRLTEMSTDARTSSRKEEENKAIVDRWLTIFLGKNYNPVVVDELAARDIFFNHSLYTPRVGPLSLKTFMAELREAFPDLCVERTANLVAEGNVVIIRWVCEGTHTRTLSFRYRYGRSSRRLRPENEIHRHERDSARGRKNRRRNGVGRRGDRFESARFHSGSRLAGLRSSDRSLHCLPPEERY